MANQPEPQDTLNNDEPTLRCNKCGRPITPEEAVLTPTGYRCPDCVRQQQKIFDTSKPLDYVWGFLVAAFLSFIGSLLARWIGFFTFLLAPAAGVGIAEAVRTVIKKRRSRKLFRLISLAIILGGVPMILMSVINLIFGLGAGVFQLRGLFPIGYQVLYLVLAVPSAYYRLSGSRR